METNEKLERLGDSVTFTYEHFHEIRNNLKRTLGVDNHHPMVVDYTNRMSKIAEIGLQPVATMTPEMIDKARERLTNIQCGIYWEDDDRR